jgi:hypothetical protein
MTSLFPSILPNGEDFVDDSYQRQELERMEYQDLQSIAAEHPSDDVHGRMSEADLVDGLTGLERV